VRETVVSKRYALALLEAAESRDALEAVGRDVTGLIELVDASEDLGRLLESPMIHPTAKHDALNGLFEGKVHPITLHFLRMLVDRRRERVTREILGRFRTLLEEREGAVTAVVQTSRPLEPEQRDALSRKLSACLNRRVLLQVEVVSGIRAGFIARAGDLVFDGTIETQLHRLRARMMGL
jgi:F-type H+-transporting ATPase subunit delta